MRASSSGLMISPLQFSLINLSHRVPTQIAVSQLFQGLTEGRLHDLVGLKVQIPQPRVSEADVVLCDLRYFRPGIVTGLALGLFVFRIDRD
jgi:hypothetical protein